MKEFRCPVCYYPDMPYPAEADNICPCCGTHFGYHDMVPSEEGQAARWASLRNRWLKHGAQFWDEQSRPDGWTAAPQLISYTVTAYCTATAPQVPHVEPLQWQQRLEDRSIVEEYAYA